MNILKLVNITAISLVIISSLSACSQSPNRTDSPSRWVIEDTCTVPSHKKLPVAFSKAKTELSNRNCHYQFDAMHKKLLSIAENDPSTENGNHFLSFYRWSVDQGIISSKQGKEYYNRYFKSTFGNVLSNDRNVCSISSTKDPLLKQLRRELIDKQTGLQVIMQDREAYFEAQRIHNELVFLIFVK